MCKKKLEKIIFFAKQKYYTDKIESCKISYKLIWRITNEITSRKKNKQGIISHLKLENGTKVMNPKNIADELNNYFVNIGSKLVSQINLKKF